MNAFYTSDYRSHLADTKTHLIGAVDHPLPPSYIPSTGYWTPTDKNLFFHALSVHSRLRPDLIAACIPGKSVADVCAYIGVLEATSSCRPLQDVELRRKLSCAMKVSSGWVELEEENAALLAAAEPLWEREAILQERAAVLQEEVGRGTMDTSRLEAQWKVDDLLSRLTGAQLKAINSIILAAAEEKSSAARAGKRKRTSFGDDVEDADPISHEPISTTSSTPLHSPVRSQSPTSPASEPDDDPASLSPASRRRYQKRMHMRRKRAELSGRAAVETVAKLKSGKKRKELEKGDRETAEVEGNESMKEEGSLSENAGELAPKRYKGRFKPSGPMPVPREKNAFAQLGIDASVLQDKGLGLIHTAALWRFMKSVLRHTGKETDIKMTIAGDTIRILEDALLQFLRAVLRRAIVLREEERRRKPHKLCPQEYIVVRNIDHALEMIGFGELRRNTEGKDGKGNRMGGRCAQERNGEHFSSVDIEDTSTDEDEKLTDEERSTSPFGFSLHHEIYTPLVWLQQQGPLSMVPELMAEETDEDALLHELSEEDELDKCDREAERTYEKGLREG